MKVTRVKVETLGNRSNGVIAKGTVVFDDQLMVHSINIIKKDDRLFVVMPESKERSDQRRDYKGRRVPWDVVHPTTKEFGNYLTDVVLAEYNRVLEEESKEVHNG